MLENLDYARNLPLHDYQKRAVNFVVSHSHAGLFLDVGMGKSLITLTALSVLPKEKTLVIAPRAIARATWIDEIDKWHAPLKYRSLIVNDNGKPLDKENRYQAYIKAYQDQDPRIYFLNKDLVTDCIKYYQKQKNMSWPFKYLVIDESQNFKSYKSKRFAELKKVLPNIERLIELTGTPAPNGLMDLWPQIYLLDRGQSLGQTISDYRSRFFKPTVYIQNHPVNWKPLKYVGYDAEQDIYQRIKPCVISMKNTTLKLPPVTYVNDKVYLDTDQYDLYQKMVKQKVLQITPDCEVTASNAAVLAGRLSQMASGALYINDEHDFIHIHDEKLKRTEYIINNTDSPVLVVYYWQSDLKMLKEYLKKHKVSFSVFDKSPEMIKNWNQGKYKAMLMQASAGVGINLQQGGHTMVWYTLPWNLEQYIQVNGRLARQGQKYPVIIHQLMTDKTIDTRILSALKQKDVTQQHLIAAVQDQLNKKNK